MSTHHKIYDDFPCIEDEIFNLIYIPLMNRYNQVTAYAVSNLALKAKLLEFSYHKEVHTSKTEKSYACSNLDISMHEIVIGKKAPEGYVIDHINGDGLLNTEENLRYATYGLNAQNKEKRSNTTSKYIGVTSIKDSNKWQASICVNYKASHLGLFENEIEAAKVYDMYAIFHYKGQSPKTNDLLSKDEIENIRCNGIPEEYQKKIRNLPKNIVLINSGSYTVKIIHKGKKYGKTVKTLDEALLLKTQILEEISEIKKNIKFSKEITRNEDGTAFISMSNGMKCLVDEDHWHDLNQYKWYWCENDNDEMYGYPQSTISGKPMRLHRYVYERYAGEIPSHLTVDHVNSKSILDVRLQNLRLADMSLQNHNKNNWKNGTDKYKGVKPTTFGYQARVNGKHYGTYKTAEEAAEKANQIYIITYGHQATLNDIDYSKQTTINNRISEENITKEYITNIRKVMDLQTVVIVKGLNTTRKNPNENINKIKLSDIKIATLDKYKQIIIDKLYPLTD